MADTTPRPAPHREPEPWGIWIGILVAVLLLVGSFVVGGLAGVAMIGVIVSLVALALLSRIVLG
ncbi:hypothetical protein HUK65_08595 [Rhodobacteraceae bacterium 2376]|uniref:Uncharacterized protein n=1 Tax=Rhabdonatronobacter sediminivivens TaxID=2743469 RepID=A0A7Z0HZB2_9RHOB|nr:hypothetical protein [Rhabdonatronobacter sediminivivens]NYS25051.1 hypothetical protein [Rhabdonatronobacter sediminivivens]